MESNIKANELRTGNILQYITAEGDKMFTSIDWQDLKWIDEDEKGFNSVHDRVLITEEKLLKCGFENYVGVNWKYQLRIGAIKLYCRFNNEWHFELEGIYLGAKLKYLHQIQNLYFDLKVEELEVNL